VSRDPIEMCRLLVGLPDVNVLAVHDTDAQVPLVVEIETRREGPTGCPSCGGNARVRARPRVKLVDLPAFGRPARLWWVKRRFECPDPGCATGTWTESDPRIASPRLRLSDRAGRWATRQVGLHGRAVAEVAADLGCAWHTVNDAVVAYGRLLVDHPDRIGDVEALGLDEVLFARQGPRKHKRWSTSIVDVDQGRLLDVVEGRDSAPVCRWLADRGPGWCGRIRYGTLDLSGPYRAVFDTMLPDVVQVADPFHVVKLAGHKLDEVRRRVQNETLGHRGRKVDPLYRARKLLLLAKQRLDDDSNAKLKGLLTAGDPRGQVTTAWHAKEAVRELYAHRDPTVALEWVDQLSRDMQDRDCPSEVRQLGRTLRRWRSQIAAWHDAQVSNGPTEALNNLAKRIKRVAFGMTNFRNWRIRVLLYAGRPDWGLLATANPA
jgi:transposase